MSADFFNSINLTIQRKSDLLFCHVDDDIVLLDMEAGQYLGFNGVASRIFELLSTPQTLNSLCTQLLEEYAITPENCEAEVKTFLQDLNAKNLLELNPQIV